MNEKYTLQFPFTSAAGERIDVLQLRRLKVKDMRAARRASDKPEEWDEPLMAAMTGLVTEDLAEMDLLDYQALQKRFQAIAWHGYRTHSNCGRQWRCWRGGFVFRPVKLTRCRLTILPAGWTKPARKLNTNTTRRLNACGFPDPSPVHSFPVLFPASSLLPGNLYETLFWPTTLLLSFRRVMRR